MTDQDLRAAFEAIHGPTDWSKAQRSAVEVERELQQIDAGLAKAEDREMERYR